MPITATPLDCEKRGQELTLYYNVGTDAVQVWVEHLGVVGDMNMPETEDLQEQSTRASDRTVKEYNQGEIELAITGTQLTDTQYEGYTFLNSMRRGGTAKDCMCLTGLISEVGSQGWRGQMRNSDRTVSGPESGSMITNFNLQPSACAVTKVRPVQIESADTVTDFDPTTFSTVST